MQRGSVCSVIAALVLGGAAAQAASEQRVATVMLDNPAATYRAGDRVPLSGTGFVPNDVIERVLLTKFDGPTSRAEDQILNAADFSLTMDADGRLSGWVRLSGIDATDHEVMLLPVARASSVASTDRFAVQGTATAPRARPASAAQITFTFDDAGVDNIVQADEQLDLSGNYTGTNNLFLALLREFSDQDATVLVTSTSVGTGSVTWNKPGAIGGSVQSSGLTYDVTTVRVKVALADAGDYTPKESSNSLPVPDGTAPTITKVEATDLTTVVVTFSEPVKWPADLTLSQYWVVKKDLTEYAVSGTSVENTGSTTITLTVADLGDRGPSGYTLDFTTGTDKFEDLAGNDLATVTGVSVADKIAPAAVTFDNPANSSTYIGNTSYNLNAHVAAGTDNSIDGILFEGSNDGSAWTPIGTVDYTPANASTGAQSGDYSWNTLANQYKMIRARAFDGSNNALDASDNISSVTLGASSGSADLTKAFRVEITTVGGAVAVSTGGDAAKSVAVTIETQNRYGVEAETYTGADITWTLSSNSTGTKKFWDDDAASSPVGGTTTADVGGVGTATVTVYYTDTKASGPTHTITVSKSSPPAPFTAGTATATNTVTINAGAVTQSIIVLPGQTYNAGAADLATAVTGSPTIPAAGTVIPSSYVVVRAVDAFFNTVTSHTGGGATVTLTSTNEHWDNASPPANFTSGVATFTGVTLKTANQGASEGGTNTSFTATTTLSTDNASSAFVVSADGASKLVAIAPGQSFDPGVVSGKSGSVTPQTAGSGFSITVRATDPWGNRVTSITHNVKIDGSSPATQDYGTPDNANLVSGEKTFAVIEKEDDDTHTFTATDQDASPLTAGSTDAIPMGPGAYTKLQILMPGETADPGTVSGRTGTPTAQTTGQNLSGVITVNVTDDYWNRKQVTGSPKYITITTTDASATIGNPNGGEEGNITIAVGLSQATLAADQFKFGSAGTFTVTAASSGLTSHTSQNVTVDPTTATKLVAFLPGETFTPGTGKGGTPDRQTAGTSFNIVVRALDANNYLASTAAQVIHITGSSTTTQNYPSNAALVNGVVTMSVTERQNIDTHTFVASVASGGDLTASTTSSVLMQAAAASRVQILVPGESATPGTTTGRTGTPTAQTVGQNLSGVITVNVTDEYWNQKTVTADKYVTITSTDATAEIGDPNGASEGNITVLNGQSQVTLAASQFKFGSAGTFTVTAANSGLTSHTSQNVTVNATTATKLVAFLPGETFTPGTGKGGTPDRQTAGTSFNIVVRALDGNNYLASTATQVIHITGSSTTTQSYPSNAALVNGVVTVSVTERQNIDTHNFVASVASGSPLTESTTSSVLMQVASAARLMVLAPGVNHAPGTVTGKTYASGGAPTPQTVNTNLTDSIRVLITDDYWNRVGYASVNITLSSSDGSATITDLNGGTAGNLTITNASFGLFLIGQFKFGTTGSQTLTATDVTATLDDYTTAGITVNAATPTQLVAFLPGETFTPGVGKGGTPSTETAGASFNITVRALDANNYVATAATHTIHITGSTSTTQTYPADAPLVNGVATFGVTERQNIGTHYFTATPSGSPSLSAANTTNAPMQAAAATQLMVLAPGVSHAPGTTTGKTGTPTSQTVNTNLTDIVRIYTTDEYWNRVLVTGADVYVDVSSTDGSPTISDLNGGASGDVTISIGQDNASFAVGEFKFGSTGTHTITATDVSGTPTLGEYTTANITVGNAGAATKILVKLPGQTWTNDGTGITGSPDAQTAGSSFNITLYVVDAGNYAVIGENSPRTIDFTTTAGTAPDGTSQPTVGASTFPASGLSVSFTEGVSADVAVYLYKAESGRTITAADAGLTNGVSSSITVGSATTLDDFVVNLTGAAERNMNFTGTNTLTARDVYHNTITSFNASGNYVTLSITTGDGTLLVDARGDAVLDLAGDFVNGVANLTTLGLKVNTGNAGGKVITATSATTKTGVSGTITISISAPIAATPTPASDTQISTGASNQTLSATLNETNAGGSYTLNWSWGNSADGSSPASSSSKAAGVAGGSVSEALDSGELTAMAGYDYLHWWFEGTDAANNDLTGTPTSSSKMRIILDPTVTLTGGNLGGVLSLGVTLRPILYINATGEMDGMSVTVTAMQLTKSGTATNADIDELRLYRDNNTNNAIDGGVDDLLQTITVDTDGKLNSPTFSGLTGQTVSGTSTIRLLIAISISSSAVWTHTIGYTISSSSNITLGQTVANISGTFPLPTPMDHSLPVELTTFTGEAKPEGIVLAWTTESEVDNAGFIICRSMAESGPFERHSELIPGHGSSPERHDYRWTDSDVLPGQVYFYKIESRDYDGASYQKDIIVAAQALAPAAWVLRPGSPNPFNPSTTFTIEVPSAAPVSLSVHDVNGRLVRTLLSGEVGAGVHRVTWNGTDERGAPVGSGVYLVQFVADRGRARQVNRVTLVR